MLKLTPGKGEQLHKSDQTRRRGERTHEGVFLLRVAEIEEFI